jgi:hypothetical protein
VGGKARKLYSPTELSVEFQKDIRTIYKRLEGTEPAERRGSRVLYYLADAAPAILGISALDPTRQRAELDEARTRKLELDIARMEGESLDRAEVQEAVEQVFGRVKDRLLAIPSAQAGRANPEDPDKAEAAIRDGVQEALDELAEHPYGSSEGAPTATKTNGVRVGGYLQETEQGVELGSGPVED